MASALANKTQLWRVNSQQPDSGAIAEAAALLRAGGLVAFPTETVYGLGTNLWAESAVRGIFHAKGRPPDNPLIVHLASAQEVVGVVKHVPPGAQLLMELFWPGPLTLILPRAPEVPDVVTAGLETVAVRVPSHPVARALLRAAGVPVPAPSANRSGGPSPTRADHVWEDLVGRIDGLLDGGPCQMGLESTVLDMTAPCPTILRPGGITREQLEAVLGSVQVDRAVDGEDLQGPTRSPGLKYTHYAPQARVFLLEGKDPLPLLKKFLADQQVSGQRVAVLALTENLVRYRSEGLDCVQLLELGSVNRLEEVASRLYHRLRECDHLGLDIVLVDPLPSEGLGAAINNRLMRAASGRILSAAHTGN